MNLTKFINEVDEIAKKYDKEKLLLNHKVIFDYLFKSSYMPV